MLSSIYMYTCIHINVHSAVATATVLQTIRPSRVRPPTSDPSPPTAGTQTLALRSTFPVIRPSSPPICNPPPGQSPPVYIYPIPPLLQCQAVRVAWFTRHRVHRHPRAATSTTAHPLRRHQDSLYYYYGIYAHAASVVLPILYEFRSTLCRVDGPMTCTIT